MRLLRSLRSLILGETWTIPLGVGATLAIALVLRSVLPRHVWTPAGGFLLVAMVALTLAASWRGSRG